MNVLLGMKDIQKERERDVTSCQTSNFILSTKTNERCLLMITGLFALFSCYQQHDPMLDYFVSLHSADRRTFIPRNPRHWCKSDNLSSL